jgi:hypothetical protein
MPPRKSPEGGRSQPARQFPSQRHFTCGRLNSAALLFGQNDDQAELELHRVLLPLDGGSIRKLGKGIESLTCLSKLVLRPVVHVEKHRHTEASERIDEPREQHYGRSQSPQHIQDGHDERPR